MSIASSTSAAAPAHTHSRSHGAGSRWSESIARRDDRDRATEGRELPSEQRPEFVTGDIREVRLEQTFDAVLMMFAVLGYQHTNAEVLDALATARAHLDVGGLFAFDVWYGPAVLSERPSERVKVIETAGQRIIRVASGSLDSRNHLCTVDYRLWTLDGDQARRAK